MATTTGTATSRATASTTPPGGPRTGRSGPAGATAYIRDRRGPSSIRPTRPAWWLSTSAGRPPPERARAAIARPTRDARRHRRPPDHSAHHRSGAEGWTLKIHKRLHIGDLAGLERRLRDQHRQPGPVPRRARERTRVGGWPLRLARQPVHPPGGGRAPGARPDRTDPQGPIPLANPDGHRRRTRLSGPAL